MRSYCTGNFVTVFKYKLLLFITHHFKLYLLAHMLLGTAVYYFASHL
jgi:hypothetical protein